MISPCCRYQFRQKLTFNLKPFAINSVLPQGRGGFVRAKVVATTLNAFMASPDAAITVEHVPNFRKVKDRKEIILEDEKVV